MGIVGFGALDTTSVEELDVFEVGSDVIVVVGIGSVPSLLENS